MRSVILAPLLVLPLAIAGACGSVPGARAASPTGSAGSGGQGGDEVADCSDGILDGTETDVDCGGSDRACRRCSYPEKCVFDLDCDNRICTAGYCRPPTCLDHRMDGDEYDVDCGGSDGTCRRCSPMEACLAPSDCSSAICRGGVCGPATCDDGVRNGDETDLDCGGSCPSCSGPPPCRDGTDCHSGVCVDGICRFPTCDDAVQNGDETGVDCGGPTCPPCSP